MTEQSVTVTASRAAIRAALRRIPQEAQADGTVARAMLVRAGNSLMGHVREAFLVKADGGTDEAGERWAPLKKATVRAKIRGIGKVVPEPHLDSDPAARRLHNIVKGGRTTHNRNDNSTKILIRTRQLLNSLTPGFPSPDQIMQPGAGEVTIGTSRAGAMAHHKGVPIRNLPQRRLWPETRRWPASWWSDMVEEIRRGLVEIATQLARGTM